ncbi:MAG: hypothetical protein M1840_002338 [Geoglossum simile]|nr:MAG: hypothetical protein M1840_002338 [Geoglossum simile]
MDTVDRDIEKAERDAAHPAQFRSVVPTTNRRASSLSSSTSTSSSTSHSPSGRMSRIPTQRSTASSLNPTVLTRIQTGRSLQSATVGKLAGTKSREDKKPLPEMGAGKPYPPLLPDQEEYVVEFEGENDERHAQNWPMKKKLYTAVILGFTTLVAAFGSSIFSVATFSVANYFHVSPEVGLLGLCLYVLGFATGPTLWAPLSELRGRRTPLIISTFGFTIFQIAVAVGKDLQTVLICRFWGGFFGACPLTVVAAVFSDMFSNRQRGLAITVFSMTVFTGPLLAPFIGGYIIENKSLGWRWTEWLTAIMGALSFLLNLFFLKETYPPVILVEKAAELRRRTKNWGIHAKQEEIEVDFRELVTKNFSRPIRLLFTEPIVLFISIYMAFIYGLLYLFLTAYPIVFQQIRGWKPGVAGLPYFGMIIGQLLAGCMVIAWQPWYNRKLKANNDIPIPEWRLPPVVIGGAAFTAGLFWFGWSGYKASVHWIVPTLSGVLTGFGLLAIFLQSLNYLVDAYLMFAASAIAANTLLRSLAGAGFPMFSQYMFHRLGVNWASTLLGFVALAMVPIPVVFIVYGAKIREKSKFAPTMKIGEDEEEERRGE